MRLPDGTQQIQRLNISRTLTALLVYYIKLNSIIYLALDTALIQSELLVGLLNVLPLVG